MARCGDELDLGKVDEGVDTWEVLMKIWMFDTFLSMSASCGGNE